MFCHRHPGNCPILPVHVSLTPRLRLQMFDCGDTRQTADENYNGSLAGSSVWVSERGGSRLGILPAGVIWFSMRHLHIHDKHFRKTRTWCSDGPVHLIQTDLCQGRDRSSEGGTYVARGVSWAQNRFMYDIKLLWFDITAEKTVTI